MSNIYKNEILNMESIIMSLQQYDGDFFADNLLELLEKKETSEMTEVPIDTQLFKPTDNWGSKYLIEEKGDSNFFLRSSGADTIMKTEDDIVISVKTMEIEVNEDLLKESMSGSSILIIFLIVFAILTSGSWVYFKFLRKT